MSRTGARCPVCGGKLRRTTALPGLAVLTAIPVALGLGALEWSPPMLITAALCLPPLVLLWALGGMRLVTVRRDHCPRCRYREPWPEHLEPTRARVSTVFRRLRFYLLIPGVVTMVFGLAGNDFTVVNLAGGLLLAALFCELGRSPFALSRGGVRQEWRELRRRQKEMRDGDDYSPR